MTLTPGRGRSPECFLAGAVAILLVCSAAIAQPAVAPPELTAAFLYNFAKFAEWPADAGVAGPLTICVFEDVKVADALNALVKGRTIGGRDVAATRGKADGLRGCHVLYLTGLDLVRSQGIVEDLRLMPVLTVSDRLQFAQTGGMVGVFVEAARMRFTINITAAERARLRISSKLLNLATIVKDDAKPSSLAQP